jgi:arabinose-5-phosphate isomerase
MRKDTPTALASDTITTALVQMTTSGLGACSIIDENGRAIGIFTDGDLRRFVTKGGNAAASNLSSFVSNNPKTIASSSLLIDAEQMFKDCNVDTIIVEESGVVVGMIDIQDLH